jgi:hypothetical protein
MIGDSGRFSFATTSEIYKRLSSHLSVFNHDVMLEFAAGIERFAKGGRFDLDRAEFAFKTSGTVGFHLASDRHGYGQPEYRARRSIDEFSDPRRKNSGFRQDFPTGRRQGAAADGPLRRRPAAGGGGGH